MIIGIDAWEGSLEIDEQTLCDNGVTFIIIRLNDMSGGHHLDTEFHRQWAEASGFLRAAYFVYNPWVDGVANAKWLLDNLPADHPPRVFCDIEVRYPDYPPATYAAEVQSFLDILETNGMRPCVYTGGWFLAYLSIWPDADYWWARYPYYLYPEVTTKITWPELIAKIEAVGWAADPADICPGDVMLWQCSADRYIPSGTERVTDINAWNGTLDELVDWWGFDAPIEQPTTDRVRVVYPGGLNIRSAPFVVTGNIIGGAYYGSIWGVLGRVKDATGRTWIQVGPTAYIAGWYTEEV